jgi:CDP-diacylglycerol--glycerol-3-phosphate 3-phosphatidyltransferase
MNMPNKLTLSRIVLTPIFLTFFIIDNPYSKVFGFLLFIAACLTDTADGHYARKYGIVTGFGKFMDPLADKILVSTALIVLVALGYARAWMVMIIIAREFYITGIRSLAAYKGTVIQASYPAKVKTTIQMIAIIFMLFVISFQSFFQIVESPLSVVLNFDHQLVFDILMGAATFMTVYSGVDYTVRYYSMLKDVLQ